MAQTGKRTPRTVSALAALILPIAACVSPDQEDGAGAAGTDDPGGMGGFGGAGSAGSGSETSAGGSGGEAGPGGSGGSSNCLIGSSPSCSAASCREIIEDQPGAPDGAYWIKPDAASAFEVRCLMSDDGGGWTLVANFPTPEDADGVPGWSESAGFGATFVDPEVGFKLDDARINAMKTLGFRAHGRATQCLSGACSVAETLFFQSSCTFAADALNPNCGVAFFDPTFSQRVDETADDTTACAWHFGLTSSNCTAAGPTGAASMVTNHEDDHTAVGGGGDFDNHAFDGRFPEDPSMEIWVK